jgi:hypothetical protein
MVAAHPIHRHPESAPVVDRAIAAIGAAASLLEAPQGIEDQRLEHRSGHGAGGASHVARHAAGRAGHAAGHRSGGVGGVDQGRGGIDKRGDGGVAPVPDHKPADRTALAGAGPSAAAGARQA